MKCYESETKRGYFSINHVAALVGVSLRTLRFYEERGLLQPRRLGHERLYSKKDIIRLNTIVKAKKFGFSLTEIWELLKGRGDDIAERESNDVTGLGLNKNELELQIEMLVHRRTLVVKAIDDLRDALARGATP